MIWSNYRFSDETLLLLNMVILNYISVLDISDNVRNLRIATSISTPLLHKIIEKYCIDRYENRRDFKKHFRDRIHNLQYKPFKIKDHT